MSEFLGFNKDRGTWYQYDYDVTEDKAVVSIMQDVQPVLDYAKEQRNSGINDKVGDFSRYAIIPAHVEVALRQRGLSIYDQSKTKDLIRVIETEYPYLKTTNLRHAIK